MFGWLKNLRQPSQRRPARELLLNEGLELAMDWGENWLAPIQDRLLRQHRYLKGTELDELNVASQAAMKTGHEVAYDLVRRKGQDASEAEFVECVLASHPWVNEGNATRLFKQSMYFAWKTGGPSDGA